MALFKAGVYTLYSSRGEKRCLVDKFLASLLNEGIQMARIQEIFACGIWNTAQGISFKCECHIIMQIQYTKNLNPGRFELGTTLS